MKSINPNFNSREVLSHLIIKEFKPIYKPNPKRNGKSLLNHLWSME